MSIEPTHAAITRARDINIELNPDLHQDKGNFIVLEIKKLQRKFWVSFALQHFVMHTIPSFLMLCNILIKRTDLDEWMVTFFLVLWITDCIFAICIFMDQEEGVSQSIDEDKVIGLAIKNSIKNDVTEFEHEDDIVFQNLAKNSGGPLNILDQTGQRLLGPSGENDQTTQS